MELAWPDAREQPLHTAWHTVITKQPGRYNTHFTHMTAPFPPCGLCAQPCVFTRKQRDGELKYLPKPTEIQGSNPAHSSALDHVTLVQPLTLVHLQSPQAFAGHYSGWLTSHAGPGEKPFHSFTPQIIIEHLPCARHCSRCF